MRDRANGTIWRTAALAVPRPVWAMALITAAFSLYVVATCAYLGVTLPSLTSKVVFVVGFRATTPIAIALFLYVWLFMFRFWRHEGGPWSALRTGALEVSETIVVLVMFSCVVYFHFALKLLIPLINDSVYDKELRLTDEWVRSLVDFCLYVRGFVPRTAAAVDLVYMYAYYVMFYLSFGLHFAFNRTYRIHYALAIVLSLSLGALGYLIYPAVGPFIYEPGLSLVGSGQQALLLDSFRNVQEHGQAWVNQNVSERFTAAPAAMPSLHVANAWIAVYYAAKVRSVLTGFMVLAFVWILIEAIATRWHYVIDLPIGFALAVVVIMLANRISGDVSTDQHVDPEAERSR